MDRIGPRVGAVAPEHEEHADSSGLKHLSEEKLHH